MPDAQRKVLIFEDNASIQTLLKFFFQKRGLSLRIAADGTEAVNAANEFSPDVILMDYNMPGKDGIEAAIDLRAAGLKTPIVMLTSKSSESDKRRALAAGVNVYLCKPFAPADLEAAIKPFLR